MKITNAADGRAATFGAVLGALLVGHNLGDHVTQTDHQAAHKATDWSAMAGHVGGYTATCAAALALLRPIGVRPRLGRVVAGLAFSAATHAVIDRRWPVQKILRATGSPRFAELQTPINGPYLTDQALHHGCLLVAALIIAGGRRG